MTEPIEVPSAGEPELQGEVIQVYRPTGWGHEITMIAIKSGDIVPGSDYVRAEDHASALGQRDERIAKLEAENAELVRKHNEQFKAAAQFAEGVVKLNAENARLAACEWKPITPDDLPKVGSETLDRDGSVRRVDESDELLYARHGMRYSRESTHFRAINPPKKVEDRG